MGAFIELGTAESAVGVWIPGCLASRIPGEQLGNVGSLIEVVGIFEEDDPPLLGTISIETPGHLKSVE